LFKVLDNPSDAQGRLELAQASTMAGIAFSNSMVGLVHSLGHALGAVAHLPHGLCMNLFLPYVLEYNKEVNGAKIGELLFHLQVQIFMHRHLPICVQKKPLQLF
jgi:alcohol dehydrogenase